jgi:Ser/Thr protein kinase RdoA (MazF antagonist)
MTTGPGNLVVAGPGRQLPGRCVRYGISPECRLHLYPLTENWTYRVQDSSGSPCVLRMYRPGGRSHEEISSELAWMTAIGAESRLARATA